MNSFIQAYRAQNPTYEGDDDALTLRYGDEYPPGQYQYPDDFVSEYNRLNSQRQVNQSSIGEEAKRGVSRGVQGLESTVEGGLALGSDLIGADRLKKYFLQKYADTSRDMEQTAAPSVPKIEDVNSFSSGAQYLAGKVGEFLPNIGEAAATAAIGTAVAPGPGTAEGAAAGFFAKTATRSALSKALKATLTPEVKEQLEQYVAGKITGKELGAEAAKLVTDSSKILGGTAASLANFAGIGAGAQYGNLANTPGVTDEDAVTGALIAGAGSSIGALIPGRALKALFPGVEETAAKSYVDLWAKKIPIELMTASGGMGAMEFFNIVSEKYADPKKRDEDFSKDDWSRMFNALAAGTLMGVPTSTIHAFRGVKTPENIEPLKENPDATLIGAQPENGQQKYPGNSPIVPVEGDNRILPAEEQTAGDQASGRGSAVEGAAVTPAAEAAAELTPEAKAVIEQKTGKTPEEIAAQAGTAPIATGDITGFKTSKGSTYELSGNSTIRTKTLHEGHDTKDVGLKPASKVTVYVSPEISEDVSSTLALNREAKPRVFLQDDKIILSSNYGILNGILYGRNKQFEHGYSTTPEVGLHPIEFWEKSVHVGNEITELYKKAGTGGGETAAESEVTPGTAATPPTLKGFQNRVKAAAVSFRPEVPESEVIKPAATVGTAIKQAPEPTSFNSIKEILDFRDARFQEERDLFKEQIGINEDQARRLQDLLHRERDTDRFEKTLTPEQRTKLNYFFDESPFNQHGSTFKTLQSDRDFDPRQVSFETEKPELVQTLVQSVNRGFEEGINDRFLSAVIAARKLKEIGASKSDIARYLDKYTTRESSSQSDKVEFFNSLGKKVNDFLSRQGIDLSEGELGNQKNQLGFSVPDASVVEEIRQKGADTKQKIKTIFPQLSNEEAAALRRQAFPLSTDKPNVRFSMSDEELPPIPEQSESQIKSSYNEIVQTLQRSGIPVATLQSGVRPLFGSLAQSLGAFDRAGRTAVLALKDITAPTRQDLRVLIEEASHAVFDKLPSAVKERVLRAMNRLDEDSPEALSSVQRDVEAAYPSGFPNDAVRDEEVAMGLFSRKLVDEGFDPLQSRGIAQQILRTVKDLYYKTAMWFQSTFLGPQYASPALAQKFFENRMRSFLSGDQEPTSLIDMLGGRKATTTEQLQYSIPAQGENRNLLQVYNPVSGQIDQNPVLIDSVEAALLNLRNDPNTRFSIPAPGAPPQQYVPPEIRLNRMAGTNNKIQDVREEIGQRAEVDPELYRKLNGLQDRVRIKQSFDANAQARNVTGYKPDQAIEDFSHETDSGPAYRDASRLLQEEHSKVGQTLDKDRVTKADLEIQRLQDLKDLNRQTDAFKDAGFMSGLVQKGLKNIVKDDIRGLLRTSKTLGAITQQYNDLAGRTGAPDPRYINALERLYDGNALNGQRMFDVLDLMANDPAIDLNQRASVIREQMRMRAASVPIPLYESLIQDTPDSRTLLATVIAYGRINRRDMALLEARRMRSGEDRAQLEQDLRNLQRENVEKLTKGIGSVSQAGGVEAVAKQEYRRALLQMSLTNRTLKNLEDRIGLNEKALPVYRRNIDEIAGKITETNDITFGDQMTIRVPTLKANGAVDWNNETINLRSTADNPTSSQELKATLDKLLAFTKDREDQAKAGSTTALGQDYQDANRAALEILDNRFYQHALRTTDHYAFELFFSDAAKQIESLGTQTATFMGRKLRQFVAETTQSRTEADRKFGFTNQRNKDALMGIINRSRKRGDKVDAGIFTRFVIDPALGFLEKQQPREGVARETDVNQAFSNLRQWLSGNDHAAGLIGRKNFDQFMPQLRKFIEGVYESGQFWRKKVTDAGQLVKDPKLFDKLRKHFDVGLFTFQRRLSDTFTSMVEAMKESGWGAEEAIKADFNQVAEMLKKGDIAGVDQMLDKYTNHSVHGPTTRKSFLHPLFHTPDESVFEAPTLDASGTKVPMDPLMAAQAHDMASRSGGGLRQAIENMYDLSGGGLEQGGQSKEDYVQAQLFNLLTTFKGAHTANEESKPQSGPVRSFVGMIPNAMIDAREFSHWPSEWFTYHDFDKNENARMAERVAGQLVYGRDNRILDNAYKTLQAETDSFVAKFKAIQEQAQRYVPNNDPKKIQAASEQLLERDNSPGLSQFKSGKEKYRFLKQTQQRSGIVPKFLNEMSDYYGRRNQDEGSLKWGTRFAQFLARLLPNNPGSAIMQMATLFDVPAAWGASPSMLKLTGRVVQIAAKDLAGSLAQGVGFKLLPLSPYEEKFRDFAQDSEVARRFGDLRSVLEGEENAPVARRLRQLSDLLSAPVNRLGENAPFTPLRPLSPFFQMIMSSNRALTVGTWELADRYVNKAAEFIRNNPGAKEVTAKDIGLGRLDSDGYDRLTQSMARYGLDMHELGTEANKFLGQGRKTILSDKTLARLYSMALNEVSLESNIATMPLGAFNSSTVRFIAPLLGWSFRRSLQLFGKRLDANDRLSMTAMRNALLGLSATALGGLGVSLAAGAYQNDVLGKKQNIRDLRVPQNLNDLIAIEERLARTGTFGLFGDLVNSVVNKGTGQGDNRAFSVDQRVVALQSMQGLINAASSYINQDFDADYSHVMRPAIAAMGGNGLLQYMQIANRMFDFDNAESRLVKRINAQNYLRVVGRDLGMEMKKSSGGYATPTPITPWISRMELAAYANNPDDFRAARQGAIEEAKASGKPDPIEYVKRTFEGHHPLRNVFNTVPSVKEYRQILQNLDEDGQTDVKEAVRLFNHYGSFIGIQPFEGSAKKDQQNSPAGLAQAQIRALSKIGSMR